MKTNYVLLFLAGLVLNSSCKKSGDVEENLGNYVVAVTPVASEGVADYLLTAASLESGKITTERNGVEQDGTYRYYVTTNGKLFSMLYGQGNPGAVTTYNIMGGRLNKISNFVTETVQAFAPVKNDLLLTKISRSSESPYAYWYRVSTDNPSIIGNGQVNTKQIAANGEQAFFSWLIQVGDKVYAPYFSVKACCKQTFGTSYPDSTWVAVFSYPDMKLEKVIKDDRTSFIGRYFTNGLSLMENGDLYGFSAAVATSDGTNINSTKPSAILRIPSGTTEFDKNYFFNVEEISGGYNITNWLYVGDNNFVVNSSAKSEKGNYTTGRTIAVVNVVNKTYKKVTGLPDDAEIISFTERNNYTPKDGKTGYIGVNLKSGIGYIYKIDAVNATATRGLKVEGGEITAIEHVVD